MRVSLMVKVGMFIQAIQLTCMILERSALWQTQSKS